MSTHRIALRIRARLSAVRHKTLSAVRKKLTPVPQTGNIPPAATRYVLEEERKSKTIPIPIPIGQQSVITVPLYIHQHPAIMIPAVTSTFGVFVGAAIASVTGRHDPTLILIVWMIFGIMFLRSALVVMRWSVQYIVITPKTIILTAGFTTREVIAIPLADLTGMTFTRTPNGVLTGYAAFRLGANSPVQLVIDYVPYPEQLFLAIRNLIGAEQDEAPSG